MLSTFSKTISLKLSFGMVMASVEISVSHVEISPRSSSQFQFSASFHPNSQQTMPQETDFMRNIGNEFLAPTFSLALLWLL